MKNEMHKTISQVMVENKNERTIKFEKRVDEIEDILLELPYTDPKFQVLVQERNNILTFLKQ